MATYSKDMVAELITLIAQAQWCFPKWAKGTDSEISQIEDTLSRHVNEGTVERGDVILAVERAQEICTIIEHEYEMDYESLGQKIEQLKRINAEIRTL